MATLRMFLAHSLQCAACGSVASWAQGKRPDHETTHANAYCGNCDVTVRVPLAFVDCEIVDESKDG